MLELRVQLVPTTSELHLSGLGRFELILARNIARFFRIYTNADTFSVWQSALLYLTDAWLVKSDVGAVFRAGAVYIRRAGLLGCYIDNYGFSY